MLLVVYITSVLASTWVLYLQGLSKSLHVSDYISDECWYVSAAINLGRRVFGLEYVPRLNETSYLYTLVIAENCSLDHVLEQLRVKGVNFTVYRKDYNEIKAIAIVTRSRLDRKSLPGACIVDLFPGLLPDASGVNEYLNLEHPPLVKYVYALLAYVVGFKFSVFRVLSLVFAVLAFACINAIPFIVYRGSPPWIVVACTAILSIAIAGLDRAVYSMSSVGMLDVYAASLDILAMTLAMKGWVGAAAVVLGLAGSAKFTGFFILPGLLAYGIACGWSSRRLATLLVVPLLVFLAISMPLIVYLGPSKWVEQLVSSLSWHMTSRPSGPPTTTPLGLLTGQPGFTLYYVDSQPLLIAASNPANCLAGLAVAVLSLLHLCLLYCGSTRLRPAVLLPGVCYLSAVLCYVAVYAAGNHTLYNFYGVQLSLLSLSTLATLPVFVEEASSLRSLRALLAQCPREKITVLLGLACLALGATSSLATARALSIVFPDTIVPPLYTMMHDLAKGDKVSTVALIASSLLLTVLLLPLILRGTRRLVVAAIECFSLGYMAPLTPYTPLVVVSLIPVAMRANRLYDGLVAGIFSPTPLLSLAAPRSSSFQIGFHVGFLASVVTACLIYGGIHPLLVLTWILADLACALAILARINLPSSLYELGPILSAIAPPLMPALLASSAILGLPLLAPATLLTVLLSVLRYSSQIAPMLHVYLVSMGVTAWLHTGVRLVRSLRKARS